MKMTYVMLALLSALVGCSKLTLENYNRVGVGMTYDQVTDLIGKPDRCDDLMGMRSCVWGDEERSVNINFVAGKVLLFSSNNLQ